MLLIILIIILVIFYISNNYKEKFAVYWSGGFIPGILPIRQSNGNYTNLPLYQNSYKSYKSLRHYQNI